MRDWFETVLPGLTNRCPTLVLDGDLPKRDWFAENRSPRLSERDGEIHTVVPGRPIGLHPRMLASLPREAFTSTSMGTSPTVNGARGLTRPRRWRDGTCICTRTSTNGAGWKSFPGMTRGGSTSSRARIAARSGGQAGTISTTRRASLSGRRGAARDTTRQLRIHRRHSVARQVSWTLASLPRTWRAWPRSCATGRNLNRVRASMWCQRESFTFDRHTDRLIAFFKEVPGARRD